MARYTHSKVLSDGATITIDHGLGYTIYEVAALAGTRTLELQNTSDNDAGVLLIGETAGFDLVHSGVTLPLPASGPCVASFVHRDTKIYWDISTNVLTSLAVANTTPDAPTLSADDTANTLSASHALGTSEILVSENSGSYVAYSGTISVGDVARAAGYWKFKIKAASGRNESAVVDSPAFTATNLWFTHHNAALETTHSNIGGQELVSSIEDQNPAHRMPNLSEPNCYRLEMTVDANKPLYVASAINGYPAVEVNSTRYLPSRLSWGPTLAKPHMSFGVFQVKTVGSNVYIISTDQASGRADVGITGGNFFIYAGTILNTSVAVVADKTYVVCVEWQTDGTTRFWINGTLAVTGNAGGTGPHSVTAGRAMGHSTAGAHAWVAEVMTYAGVMSDSARTAKITELMTKYAAT